MTVVDKDDDILHRLKNIDEYDDSELTLCSKIVRRYFDELSDLRDKGISWRKIAQKIDKNIKYRTLSSAFDREQKRRKASIRKEAGKNKEKTLKGTINNIRSNHQNELQKGGYSMRPENKTSQSIKPVLSSPAGVVDQDVSNI